MFAGILVLLLLATLINGCISKPTQENPGSGGTKAQFKEIQRFKNFEELTAAFKEAQQNRKSNGIIGTVIAIATLPAMMPMMAVSSMGASSGTESAKIVTDFSQTNVQVEGVDEADIVKTDGRFIYNFSANRLVITDAFPIESAKIVSKTELESKNGSIFPKEMFVNEDKLLVFGSRSGYAAMPLNNRIANQDYYPYYRGGQTVVMLYNIEDRSNPVLEKEFEFEGSYLSSRMIGKFAYFVVNSYPQIFQMQGKTEEDVLPSMWEDGVERKIASSNEIGFLPPTPPSSFVTIASIDLDSKYN